MILLKQVLGSTFLSALILPIGKIGLLYDFGNARSNKEIGFVHRQSNHRLAIGEP